MPPFSERAECPDGERRLLRGDRNDFRPGQREKPLQPLPPSLALAALNDEGQFDAADGRYEPDGCALDRLGLSQAVILLEQDRDHGGRVDDHQPHIPASS